MLKESAPRQEFFSEEEYHRLLAKMPEELKAPLAFAFTMGWRIKSEVLSLTWERVDRTEGTVTLLTGTTKNGKGRVIYLPDELRAMLEHQHQTRPAECPWVFHRGGKRIKDFRGAWDTACQEAFLRGKVSHDLRRSAVRNLVRAGIPETVAMKVTGHADRSVFERYNIVSPGDLQQVAKVLSQRDMPANNDKNNDNRSSAPSENRLSS